MYDCVALQIPFLDSFATPILDGRHKTSLKIKKKKNSYWQGKTSLSNEYRIDIVSFKKSPEWWNILNSLKPIWAIKMTIYTSLKSFLFILLIFSEHHKFNFYETLLFLRLIFYGTITSNKEYFSLKGLSLY